MGGNGWRREWLAALILIIAGVVVYLESFSGVLFFDDLSSIPENPHVRQLWPLSRALTAPPQTAVAGRPVVSLTLAINYAVGGLDVRGYHVFNLTVHLLSALLLFGIVRRTLQSPMFRDRFDRSAPWLAITVAAIWMIHPLQSESVTYVILRTELLMGLFYLLTLYCAIRGWTSRRRRIWFAAAVVACSLGMASKEVMVSAPLMVLLYDRAFVSGSFGASLRRRAGLYAGLAATWIILISLMISGPRSDSVGFGLGISALDYLRTQAEVLVWYLRLCVWPDPLVVSYEWELAKTLSACMPQGLVIVVLLAVTAWALWRRPSLGFAGAWFFLILAPTSSIVPIITEVAGERRMYLPLASVVALFVIGGHRVLQTAFRRLALRVPLPQLISGGLVIALAALLGYGTFQRNKDYRSVLSIWADAVAKRPKNYRAHSNLAGAFIEAGQLDSAVRHGERALNLKPDHVRARANLALALKRQGRIDKAIQHYKKALRVKAQDPKLHHNLAIALAARGDVDEAIEHYGAALRIRPESPLTHLNLAEALVAQGRLTEAVHHYSETLRLNSGMAVAHYNLGNVLFRQGKIDDAMEHYTQAVRIKPAFADARVNLGVALVHKGRTTEAVDQYRAALQIDPQHPQAREHLNAALAVLRNRDTR